MAHRARAQDELGSAIQAAVKKQDTDEVRRLLSQLGDPLIPLNRAEKDLVLPALLVALEEGYVDTADLILTRGPGLVNYLPVDKAAIWGAHIPIVECLVKHGWNVNGDLDNEGYVLGYAFDSVGEENPEFCRWLIDHGADVNPPNNPSSMGTLEKACYDAPALVPYLLEKGYIVSGYRPLCRAAQRGEIEALRLFLSKEGGGLDINAAYDLSDDSLEKYHGTALHAAAASGKVDSVKFLLSKGADKNVRNRAGLTPKDVALSFNRPECVAALEEETDLE